MNDKVLHEYEGVARLLRGTISGYRKRRRNQDFMFNDQDKARIDATAVGAALVGLGGIAVGLASSGMDTGEEADLIEFDLDGKKIRAWVWLSVFNDGDQVEVVAEPIGEVWQGYAIRRPADNIVALHPHCSKGRKAHWRATFRWYLKLVMPLIILFIIFGYLYTYIKYGYDTNWSGISIGLIGGSIGASVIYAVIAYNIGKRFLGFVRMAEEVFLVFGWRDVQNIDLSLITKKNKIPSDPGALGVLYFRIPAGEVEGRG